VFELQDMEGKDWGSSVTTTSWGFRNFFFPE
jgi:hypothetical protein